ncbi:hypothetical protein TRVL_00048 [Trypanosoma vivax]|nr:hypothetical protein TRVL_00048 [Trypanosoma vivax]
MGFPMGVVDIHVRAQMPESASQMLLFDPVHDEVTSQKVGWCNGQRTQCRTPGVVSVPGISQLTPLEFSVTIDVGVVLKVIIESTTVDVCSSLNGTLVLADDGASRLVKNSRLTYAYRMHLY